MGKVNIKLLESKNVHTTQNNVSLDAQNNYKVIAGEDNATEFVIEPESSIYDEQGYVFRVGMVNAAGGSLPPAVIENKTFTLPKTMAVPGYTHLYISATLGDVVVQWMFVKVKVWSYAPDWNADISSTAEKIFGDVVNESLQNSTDAKSSAATALLKVEDLERRANTGEFVGPRGTSIVSATIVEV